MFIRLLKWFASLIGLWKEIPDDAREKIVDSIVEAFSDTFKAFYRASNQKEKTNKQDQKPEGVSQ